MNLFVLNLPCAKKLKINFLLNWTCSIIIERMNHNQDIVGLNPDLLSIGHYFE